MQSLRIIHAVFVPWKSYLFQYLRLVLIVLCMQGLPVHMDACDACRYEWAIGRLLNTSKPTSDISKEAVAAFLGGILIMYMVVHMISSVHVHN